MKKIFTIMLLSAFLGPLACAAISPPSDIAIIYSGGNIELRWADAASTSPVALYTIYRATDPAVNETNWSTMPQGITVSVAAAPPVSSYVDPGINSALVYYYKINAIDTLSNTSALSAAVKTAPYAPDSLTATAFNSKVFLNWSTGYDPVITAYNIYRSTTSEALAAQYIGRATGDYYLDDRAVNLVKYYYRIKPYGNGSEGPFSYSVTTTAFAAPFAPPSITKTAAGLNVAITWTVAGTRGSYDVAGYKIYRSLTYGDEASFSTTVAGPPFNETLASYNTRYYYRLRTIDVNGNVSTPADFSMYIPSAAPSAPQNVTITSSNARRVNLSWSPNDAAESVTSYAVYRDTVQVGGTSTTNYSDFPLNPGSAYMYTVRAMNINSLWGADSSPVYITVTPAAPSGFSAYKGTTPVTVQLLWNVSDAEESVTGYNVFRAPNPASFDFANPSYISGSGNFEDTTVTAGTAYFYCVSAYNSVSGAASAFSSAKPVTLPAQPTGLAASPNRSYINLSWNALTADYDAAGYRLYRSLDDVVYVQLTQTAAVLYNDLTMTAATTFYYKITALNFYGESDLVSAASVSAQISLTAAPDAPVNVTAAAEGDGKVSLSWKAAPAGSGVTSYNVYRAISSGGYNYSAVYAVVTAASFIDQSVTQDTDYYYTVKAQSDTESLPSAEVSAKPFKRPESAANLKLSNLNGSIMLVWSAPPVPLAGTYQTTLKYNIYRSTSASGFINIAPLYAAHSDYYVDSGVNTSVSAYYYKVKVADDKGNEDNSTSFESIAVSPLLSPPSVLIARAGDSRVSLIWRKLSPIYYNIYRSETSGSYTAPLATYIEFGDKEYIDTTAVNGHTYYYVITSVGDAGEGPRSNEASATPYTAVTLPADPAVHADIANKKDVQLSWNAAIPGSPFTLAGYQVNRSSDNGGTYSVITTTPLTAFLDALTEWDTKYFYLIKTVDSGDNIDASYPLVSITLPLPANKLRIFRNMINLGLNETLRLRYFITQKGMVRIRIYTMSGAFVAELVNAVITEELSATNPLESQDIYWDGKNTAGKKVSAGIYLISLELDNVRVTGKVAVVK